MSEKVLIFGKDTCPYTTAAREDYEVRYVNIRQAAGQIKLIIREFVF